MSADTADHVLAPLRAVLDAALDALGARDRRVVEDADPRELRTHFAKVIEGGLALGGAAAPTDAIADAARLALRFAVHTDHPRFLNQNFAGADPVAVIGDALGAALNTTTATYEAAPVFTLMEREVMRFLADKIGWSPAESSAPAGLFFPGGSAANTAALQIARVAADPECLERGARGGPDLVALTSERSHYSIDKGARFIGLGAAGVHKVACDANGAMRMDALAASLEQLKGEGRVPYFLNLTAGTTVQGAFDPVAPALAIARKHGLWAHIDGAVGGGVLFSERERARLKGCEGADSMTWNLHKLSGATQQCSALLLREPDSLRRTFSTRADYLFQADKRNLALDLGDLSFTCARRNDALKAWLLLKARGEKWLGARIDHALDLAQRLEREVRARPEFELAAPRVFSHVCFRWLPQDMRDMDEATRAAPQQAKRLHALAPKVKAAMQAEGDALIGYQPVNEGANAWRMLFINPAVTWEDALACLDLIARLSRAQLHDVAGN